MQHAFKRIGAAVGSALMLGSTFAGAALAANVADFYDGIAVMDGSADDTLIAVGTGGTSPSGLAADVVSAIGIASEIGDHRMTEAAGGVGDVTLSVESTAVDGKTLESQLGMYTNASLTTNSITFYAPAQGGTVLSTLKSGYVRNRGGTNVLNQETLAVKLMEAGKGLRFDYQAGDLVTSSDSTAGYDATECEIDYLSNWVVYTSKFDSPVDFDDALKSQTMRFLGKDYTVLSASATELKLAGSGTEQTLLVGDEGIEFDDAVITLESVMTQGTTGTADKALVKVVNDGTTVSKLINEGSTDTLNGIEVTILSAGPSYLGDSTVGSANILLGGNALTLKTNQAMTTGSPWTVSIQSGDDSTSTDSTSDGLSYIKLSYSQGSTGSSAIPAGGTVTQMDALDGLLTLNCNGLSEPLYKDLAFELVGETNLDNEAGSTVTHVLKVSYPDKIFTDMDMGGSYGTVDVDTIYVALGGNEGKTPGNFFFTGTSAVTSNYTDSTLKTKTLIIGDKQWTLTADITTESYNGSVTLQEPAPKYPLGTTSGNTWTMYLYNQSGVYNYIGTSTSANAVLVDYDGYTTNYVSGQYPVRRDSSSIMKALTGFVSKWGTKLSASSQAQVALGIPVEQALPNLVIGSTSTATETTTASLGGDAVTIGGVDISATGTASSLSLDEWPMPVAKVDSDVTPADKSGKNLILVGGPVVNSLTAALADKLDDLDCAITNDAPGAGKGRVAVIEDAFEDGMYAVVVAGSDRAGTVAAAQLLQALDEFEGDADAACVTVEYVSAGEVPTAVATAAAEEEEEEEE